MSKSEANLGVSPKHHRVCFLIAAGLVLFSISEGTAAETSKVTINADQVLVIDGKKIFPIAFTMPPPPDGRTPPGKNALEELHDAGANFLRTGVMGTAWNDAALELEQKYHDAAARFGMHCLVNLRELGSIGPDDTAKEARLRQLVNRFKDHPGMGAWKHVDEPEWGKHPLPPMLRATQIIRELDPHHPIEITQAPRGTIETLRPYNATCDIIAADIYPIGYPPGGALAAAEQGDQHGRRLHEDDDGGGRRENARLDDPANRVERRDQARQDAAFPDLRPRSAS